MVEEEHPEPGYSAEAMLLYFLKGEKQSAQHAPKHAPSLPLRVDPVCPRRRILGGCRWAQRAFLPPSWHASPRLGITRANMKGVGAGRKKTSSTEETRAGRATTTRGRGGRGSSPDGRTAAPPATPPEAREAGTGAGAAAAEAVGAACPVAEGKGGAVQPSSGPGTVSVVGGHRTISRGRR